MKKYLSVLAAATLAMSFSSISSASDRSTYSAYTRGTTTTIPESRVIALCGDIDGCKVRISMYNWDGNLRTATRETLMFYNSLNGNWRDLAGDTQGTSGNNGTQHVQQAWSCYFTDGRYYNWVNQGDTSRHFGVLSWNQYNASACRVTLID